MRPGMGLSRKIFGTSDTRRFIVKLESLKDVIMLNNENMRKHWVIFNHKGYQPTKIHRDIKSAVAEAVRLAEKQPGDHFVVYEAVRVASSELPKARVYVIDGHIAGQYSGSMQWVMGEQEKNSDDTERTTPKPF